MTVHNRQVIDEANALHGSSLLDPMTFSRPSSATTTTSTTPSTPTATTRVTNFGRKNRHWIVAGGIFAGLVGWYMLSGDNEKLAEAPSTLELVQKIDEVKKESNQAIINAVRPLSEKQKTLEKELEIERFRSNIRRGSLNFALKEMNERIAEGNIVDETLLEVIKELGIRTEKLKLADTSQLKKLNEQYQSLEKRVQELIKNKKPAVSSQNITVQPQVFFEGSYGLPKAVVLYQNEPEKFPINEWVKYQLEKGPEREIANKYDVLLKSEGEKGLEFLASTALENGFSPELMLALLVHENSKVDPNAESKNANGTKDCGLFQTNEKTAENDYFSCEELKDPINNTILTGDFIKKLLESTDTKLLGHIFQAYMSGKGSIAQSDVENCKGLNRVECSYHENETDKYATLTFPQSIARSNTFTQIMAPLPEYNITGGPFVIKNSDIVRDLRKVGIDKFAKAYDRAPIVSDNCKDLYGDYGNLFRLAQDLKIRGKIEEGKDLETGIKKFYKTCKASAPLS